MAELVWETDMVKGTPCLKQLRAFILIIQLVTCLRLMQEMRHRVRRIARSAIW